MAMQTTFKGSVNTRRNYCFKNDRSSELGRGAFGIAYKGVSFSNAKKKDLSVSICIAKHCLTFLYRILLA